MAKAGTQWFPFWQDWRGYVLHCGVGNNVALVYGGGSIKKNGIYDAVTGILKSEGKTVTEIAGVMPNPTIHKLYEGVENMEEYDIIFLGYPIWWGDAPRIIASFMESYDFSKKTIVPFCTSGGSGIGSSAENLHSLAASDVTWMDGERLDSGSSRDDMINWIGGLGLNITTE